MLQDVLTAFRDAGFAALAAFLVSLVSLIVSTVALVGQSRLNKRLLTIKEGRDQRAVCEASQARLRATKTPQGSDGFRLRITNHGGGEARQVRVVLDGRPISEHPWVCRGKEDGWSLDPGADHVYDLSHHVNAPEPKRVDLQWDDDAGGGSHGTSL